MRERYDSDASALIEALWRGGDSSEFDIRGYCLLCSWRGPLDVEDMAGLERAAVAAREHYFAHHHPVTAVTP